MFRAVFVPLMAAVMLASLPAFRSGAAQGTPGESTTAADEPREEQDLIAIFTAAAKDYDAAREDEAGARARDARLEIQVRVMETLRRNVPAQGWTGIVRSRGLTPDGDAWISIDIGGGVTISTWKTNDDDTRARTLLKRGSPLFVAAQNAKVGQAIRFTGYFLLLMNAADEDMILHPQFIMAFTDLRAA
jgi:hypothetical protein